MTTPRVDVVTIFPDYLAPLSLSLVGAAQRKGLVRTAVHDLRDWTQDRHRSVDDTPAGGGAGMVMRPDVWGAALDEVLDADATHRVLLLPTPAGEPFTQAAAAELASALGEGAQLVIACGRYEGVDTRVAAHYRGRDDVTVREVSLGDYVLNGGEVAALAITEAVVRLLPGVVGNPESVVEESHGADGLLEHPAYTQPPQWRGLEVPAVLRSGDHAAIARWRRARAVELTARRRPDLLAPHEVTVREARARDLDELVAVAAATFPLACPPELGEADVAAFVATNLSRQRLSQHVKARASRLLVAERAGALIGYTLTIAGEPQDPEVAAAVTARPAAELSKCYVLPEHHGSGAAAALVAASVDAAAAAGAAVLWLGVNARNERARRFYGKHGLVRVGGRSFTVGTTVCTDDVLARPLTRPGAS